MAEMEKRFKNALLSVGQYTESPLYCAFSKEKSKTCYVYDYGKYPAHGIIYDRDEYWNKTARIPCQVSVFLLSSNLDAQTPHEYAECLLETLDGGKKELVAFNTSVYGALAYAALDSGDGTCGMKILASFVKSKGDLKRLDKSCLDELQAFNLTAPVGYQANFFGTDDAYDGVFNSRLQVGPDARTRS
ncbi:hypothetical protein ON010_g19046 [Phytophthora cinnamomi]|nr:hypothetical protein ON010_g19046 [Phytophthora cinnamomi]